MITVSTPTGDNASCTGLRRRLPDIVVTANGTPSTARLPMRKIWNGTGTVSDGRKIGFSCWQPYDGIRVCTHSAVVTAAVTGTPASGTGIGMLFGSTVR